MGGVGSGPHSSEHTQERVRRVFARAAPGCALTLAKAGVGGDRESARLVLAWCIGNPLNKLEAAVDVALAVDASRLQQALDQARLAVLQAQDTAMQALPPAPLDTANTPE